MNCGVATIDPWPTAAELDLAYSGAYRPAGGRFSGVGDAVLRRTRARLSKRLDEIAPPGPVLDVGAGDGTLVNALRDRGRESAGLERPGGPKAPAAATFDDEPDGWAAIVFWHSLEHLPAPGAALDGAAAALRPDGVLIVAVPNSASLQACLFGARWFALDPPRHLVHLTSSALLRRLRGTGTTIERVSYLRGGQVVFGWLDGIVATLPPHPSLYDAIRRPQARSAPLRRRTRWGALTVALLALPLASVAALAEALGRRGGTVYVEARRV